jgi:hypothetical protein
LEKKAYSRNVAVQVHILSAARLIFDLRLAR